jgi:hypothetical protein
VPGAKIHKIRITLTSSNVKNLEKCMSHLLSLSLKLTFTISQSPPTSSTGLKISSFVSRVLSVFPPSRSRSLCVKLYVFVRRDSLRTLNVVHFSLVVKVQRLGIPSSSRFTSA